MARPTSPTFADRYQLRTFGNDYTVRYDTVLDHDTYSWLRVSFEIPREDKDTAVLVLNGKEIGTIKTVRDERKHCLGFAAFRHPLSNDPIRPALFKELGHAAAAIITDYVE